MKFYIAVYKMKDWEKIVVKLNRLIYRRGQQFRRYKFKELVDFIELDDLINLKVQSYEDFYIKKKDSEGIVLFFLKIVIADLPAGFGFDKFGFII